jgi:Tfp pilus assembly protein PilF
LFETHASKGINASIFYDAALHYFTQHQWQKSIALLKKALSKDSKMEGALELLIDCRLHSGEDTKSVMHDIQKLCVRHPLIQPPSHY